jgi:hypothetical protein
MFGCLDTFVFQLLDLFLCFQLHFNPQTSFFAFDASQCRVFIGVFSAFGA